MRFYQRNLLAILLAAGSAGLASAADYGLPAAIQDGNILHCFNWTMAEVKAELPNLAAAGYGSVQLSPLQRPDAKKGEAWHALYRPYDLAFKSSGMGSEQDLKGLCDEAAKYGIKVIVDVVANHVDKTAGYHDTWWDANGRVRWNGGIDYNNRYSVTHGQLGDYGDVNSEDSEVCARGKAYVQKLHDLGVRGIRWDAAKHIGLPSEGCNFWSSVTSVAGMWHYGEILDEPATGQGHLIKEYVKYMSVTDNKYADGAAKENGGIPYGFGGDWVVNQGVSDTKLVYWGESHDTYSNDGGWSKYKDQGTIDRAYAAFACRNGAAALYLSRPDATDFNSIKVGKGSKTAYKSKAISEVNKFRNAMVGKADWCEASGNAFCVTRQNGGAVIVMKGSGNVSVKNGGGYCPAGTYTDKVSGGTFTVTASTISGNVGSSGIAVIYNGGGTPGPDPGPGPEPTPEGSMYILGNLGGGAGWSTTPGTGVAMTLSGNVYSASNVEFVVLSGETKSYFNFADKVGATWDELNMNANRYGAATEGASITLGTPASVVKYANNVDASGCLSWTVAPGKYDVKFDASAMTVTLTKAGTDPDPGPGPGPDPVGTHYIYYDGTLSAPQVWAWNDSENCTVAGTWGGDNMTRKNNMWYWEVPAGKSLPTGLIIHEGDNKIGGGDLVYVDKATYHQDGSYTTGGDDPYPPVPGTDITIYYDNSVTSWSTVNCYSFANSTANNGQWPGNPMTLVSGMIYKATIPAGSSVVFNNGSSQTVDVIGVQDKHIYKGLAETQANAGGTMCNKVEDGGVYQDGPTPTKPVVTANPASGATFQDDITVTLTVSPAATIYYTTNGSSPSTASSKYASALTFSETTTLRTLAVTTDGAQNEQSFTYTKTSTPTPGPDPVLGNNLVTDYYKVNPNGQVGSRKTVNMSFNGMKSTTAMSNWSESDIIAQGVARDVCQAFKGKHERPIIDSYAIYAAYDNDNLYLGVQFVYTIWDEYGEGKQPGESKPYNMDGRLMWAFDLDPHKAFDGYINGTKGIWNDEGKPGAKFDNGVDAVWIGSSKPGVGTPGLFLPTPDGHASYDAAYCKSISGSYYGYADGLHPSISQIWGQAEFEYDPNALKGNEGFVDLTGEIDNSAHTFYEWKLPLSVLGITADYIQNTGIGVMYLDVYGSSPVGGTPYDPSFFDNAKNPYSMDSSSSEEKEDEDIITYAPARVGKLLSQSGVENISMESADVDVEPEYYNLQGVRVIEPTPGMVVIERRGNVVTKKVVR